jgi:hypothetical protein
MTDLQLGLAVIGALAVAGVLLYNRLQERAVRRETERAFKSGHADVLVGDAATERREPSLGAPPPRREEPLADAARPDPRVDYVIELSAAAGLDTTRLRESWHPIESRFGRRALLAPGDDARCQAALQMVSRNGVVSDAELLEFRSEVETLAAALGATVSAPEMRGALDEARELDRACADADIQVALHVIGGGAGGEGSDELAGLGEQPFHVEQRAEGVTLTLDVPRTHEPGRGFEAMARAARHLAAARGGRLADDNGNAVDERSLAAIGAELEAVRQALLARGIEPGGPLALRLFS